MPQTEERTEIKERRGKFQTLLKKVPKRVTVTVLCGVLTLLAIAVFSPLTQTYIVDDDGARGTGEKIVVQTTKSNTEAILAASGLNLKAQDEIQRSANAFGPDTLQVCRAYTVHVEADGISKDVVLASGDVSGALALADINVNAEDYVSIDLDHPTSPNMTIVVNRVEYDERVVEEEIPYSIRATQTYLLGKGQSRVVTAGVTGTRELTYKDKVVDGKIVESTLIASRVTAEPKTQVVASGLSPKTPYSTIEPPSSFSLTAAGVPTKYRKVMRNAIATAYSAGPGAGTASGIPIRQGTVAVNPKVIPYGTHLYIATADNSYVYGYAIAADTGTALMDGRIDVDVFFNSYNASCQWGKKLVNIYILD